MVHMIKSMRFVICNLVLTEDFAQDFDKKMVIPIPRKGLWNQKFNFENRKIL